MSSKPFFLKPRSTMQPAPWDEIAVDAPELGPQTRLDEAQFVALDVETTGNAPFLVLEIGAERFRLNGPLSFFDTLVDCQAPINPYAHRRHHIDRSMLIGAPEFRDARRAFLRFAHGAVLVEQGTGLAACLRGLPCQQLAVTRLGFAVAVNVGVHGAHGDPKLIGNVSGPVGLIGHHGHRAAQFVAVCFHDGLSLGRSLDYD